MIASASGLSSAGSSSAPGYHRWGHELLAVFGTESGEAGIHLAAKKLGTRPSRRAAEKLGRFAERGLTLSRREVGGRAGATATAVGVEPGFQRTSPSAGLTGESRQLPSAVRPSSTCGQLVGHAAGAARDDAAALCRAQVRTLAEGAAAVLEAKRAGRVAFDRGGTPPFELRALAYRGACPPRQDARCGCEDLMLREQPAEAVAALVPVRKRDAW